MAKAPDTFTQHILEQLEPLGAVTARAMFGAWCIMLDGNMLAIVEGGRLFFKVDATTGPVFAAAGGAPFTYFHKGKGVDVEMPYRTIPDGDLDDRHELLRWARLAADVSRAAGLKKAAKKRAKKPAAKRRADA